MFHLKSTKVMFVPILAFYITLMNIVLFAHVSHRISNQVPYKITMGGPDGKF